MTKIVTLEQNYRSTQPILDVTNTLIAKIGQKVLTNIDLLRKGGVEGAIDALKGLIR